MSQPNHLFCFGLGYSALTLATRLLAQGWRVSGTSRSADKCESVAHLGITAHIFDTDLPLQNEFALQGVTHIVHSIPPYAEGDPVYNNHGELLSQLPDLQWFGYLSTTGVYGDYQGAWVDETSQLRPPNDRSRYREEAENRWLNSGLPTHVFRLSGIYGAKRSTLSSLQNGTAKCIVKDAQVFSRIHVEDIANILEASLAKPHNGSIYNCADDEPEASHIVTEYAAELLGIAPPPRIPFEEADMSKMARSFYGNCRRVSNQKIKEELGVTLTYPNYRKGLDAIYNGISQ